MVDELFPILLVPEQLTAFNSTCYDVVKTSGEL